MARQWTAARLNQIQTASLLQDHLIRSVSESYDTTWSTCLDEYEISVWKPVDFYLHSNLNSLQYCHLPCYIKIVLTFLVPPFISIPNSLFHRFRGVMNHCLPILRGCHELTSQLVPITQDACQTEQQSDKIEELACKVTPRLDDVVQLLEGPLDPRLVEAR